MYTRVVIKLIIKKKKSSFLTQHDFNSVDLPYPYNM